MHIIIKFSFAEYAFIHNMNYLTALVVFVTHIVSGRVTINKRTVFQNFQNINRTIFFGNCVRLP